MAILANDRHRRATAAEQKARYDQEISGAFARAFDPINNMLEGYNLQLPDDEKYNTTCSDSAPRQFRSYYVCEKFSRFNGNPVTRPFVNTWQNLAPSFEEYLIGAGWVKTWNPQRPLADLFTDLEKAPPNNIPTGVGYARDDGKVRCLLTFSYMYYVATPLNLNIDENCYRTAGFFVTN